MIPTTPTNILRDGQPVVLIDRKQRQYYAVLQAGHRANVRGDRVPHDLAIGQPDGIRVTSPAGREYDVLSASLTQHMLNMTRHGAIIYPKDVAAIVFGADISTGHTVVEAGLGSGSLTMGLLRAVGPTGRVITYENRPSCVGRARKNIRAFMGEVDWHEIREGDVYEGIDLPEGEQVDHVVLDVAEPWEMLPHIQTAGSTAIYVPTVPQTQQVVTEMRRAGGFALIVVQECWERFWHVTERSVRPEQQMTGHTGFLIFARRTNSGRGMRQLGLGNREDAAPQIELASVAAPDGEPTSD